MPIPSRFFWYFLALVTLIHVQFNMGSFWLLVGASVAIGCLPIRGVRWWHYALLSLCSLLCCMALKFPEAETLSILTAVSQLPAPLLIGLTVVVTAITVTLTSYTSHLLLACSFYPPSLWKR